MSTRFGVDTLGAAMYEKNLLRVLRPKSVVCVFYNTFVPRGRKNNKSTVENLARSGKVETLIIQVAPFDYAHRYELSKYLAQVKKDFREIEAIALANPQTDFILSPFCEHTHSKNTMLPVFNELQSIAPHTSMMNSIWSTGQEVPGTITDIHLENSRPKAKPRNPRYTVSFDGFGGSGSGDFPDGDISSIIARYPDALWIRAWNFQFNGKYGNKDDTPANERKEWPSPQYIRGTLLTLRQREGTPTWESNKLLKSFADDHKGDAAKDNKLLAILPWAAESAEVLDSKGRVIDKMYRFRPDHTGEPRGPRYYSNRYAYQVADIAVKNTGSALIKIRVGRNVTKLTDGYLRSGRFK